MVQLSNCRVMIANKKIKMKGRDEEPKSERTKTERQLGELGRKANKKDCSPEQH